MDVHGIMYIGNMWKLLFGPEDVWARASAAGGSAQIEQLYINTL